MIDTLMCCKVPSSPRVEFLFVPPAIFLFWFLVSMGFACPESLTRKPRMRRALGSDDGRVMGHMHVAHPSSRLHGIELHWDLHGPVRLGHTT